MSFRDDGLIRVRPGMRVLAIGEVPARTFEQRWILPGWTYEIAEYDVIDGRAVIRVALDEPRRWLPLRFFVEPGAAEDWLGRPHEPAVGSDRLVSPAAPDCRPSTGLG